MNREDFIKICTEWMNMMADELFPQIFSSDMLEEKKPKPTLNARKAEMPIVKKKLAMKPRAAYQYISSIAKHYGVDAHAIRVVLDELGILQQSDRHEKKITREDTIEVVKHIQRKYNNFN